MTQLPVDDESTSSVIEEWDGVSSNWEEESQDTRQTRSSRRRSRTSMSSAAAAAAVSTTPQGEEPSLHLRDLISPFKESQQQQSKNDNGSSKYLNDDEQSTQENPLFRTICHESHSDRKRRQSIIKSPAQQTQVLSRSSNVSSSQQQEQCRGSLGASSCHSPKQVSKALSYVPSTAIPSVVEEDGKTNVHRRRRSGSRRRDRLSQSCHVSPTMTLVPKTALVSPPIQNQKALDNNAPSPTSVVQREEEKSLSSSARSLSTRSRRNKKNLEASIRGSIRKLSLLDQDMAVAASSSTDNDVIAQEKPTTASPTAAKDRALTPIRDRESPVSSSDNIKPSSPCSNESLMSPSRRKKHEIEGSIRRSLQQLAKSSENHGKLHNSLPEMSRPSEEQGRSKELTNSTEFAREVTIDRNNSIGLASMVSFSSKPLLENVDQVSKKHKDEDGDESITSIDLDLPPAFKASMKSPKIKNTKRKKSDTRSAKYKPLDLEDQETSSGRSSRLVPRTAWQSLRHVMDKKDNVSKSTELKTIKSPFSTRRRSRRSSDVILRNPTDPKDLRKENMSDSNIQPLPPAFASIAPLTPSPSQKLKLKVVDNIEIPCSPQPKPITKEAHKEKKVSPGWFLRMRWNESDSTLNTTSVSESRRSLPSLAPLSDESISERDDKGSTPVLANFAPELGRCEPSHNRSTRGELIWTRNRVRNFSDWCLVVASLSSKNDSETEEETYYLHRSVVGTGDRSSDYLVDAFHQQTAGGTTRVTLEPRVAQAVPIMLDYMYDFHGRPLKITTETAVALRKLSDLFGIPCMFEEVNAFIMKDMKEENIPMYMDTALDCKDLKTLKAAIQLAALSIGSNNDANTAPQYQRFQKLLSQAQQAGLMS